jgi:hypothetical protein
MAICPADMNDCKKKKKCLFGPNEGKAYNPSDPCCGQGEFDAATCDCGDLGTGFISVRYWIIDRETNRYSCSGGGDLPDTCGANSPLLRSFFVSNGTLLSWDYGTINAIQVRYGCDCPGDTSAVASILNINYIDHDDNSTEKTYNATGGTGAQCVQFLGFVETRDRYVWIETFTVNTDSEVITIIDREGPPGSGGLPGDCFDTPYPQ